MIAGDGGERMTDRQSIEDSYSSDTVLFDTGVGRQGTFVQTHRKHDTRNTP